MLVSLSVANFRSFGEEQTFSMVASDAWDRLTKVTSFPFRVLRRRWCAPESSMGPMAPANQTSSPPCGIRNEWLWAYRPSQERPGLHFARVRFGTNLPRSNVQFLRAATSIACFSVDDDKIIEEWLVHVVGTKEKPIYERATDADRRVEIDASGLTDASKKLEALVTVGGRHNQSFLATIRANLEPEDRGEHLSAAIRWLQNDLTLIGPTTKPKLLSQFLAINDDFREFAGGFLKASATGVDQLKVDKVEIQEEEARSLVSDSRLAKAPDQAEDQRFVALRLPNGRELLIEQALDGRHFYRVVIHTAHRQLRRRRFSSWPMNPTAPAAS